MKRLMEDILRNEPPRIPMQYSNGLWKLIQEMLIKDPELRPDVATVLRSPVLLRAIPEITARLQQAAVPVAAVPQAGEPLRAAPSSPQRHLSLTSGSTPEPPLTRGAGNARLRSTTKPDPLSAQRWCTAFLPCSTASRGRITAAGLSFPAPAPLPSAPAVVAPPLLQPSVVRPPPPPVAKLAHFVDDTEHVSYHPALLQPQSCFTVDDYQHELELAEVVKSMQTLTAAQPVIPTEEEEERAAALLPPSAAAAAKAQNCSLRRPVRRTWTLPMSSIVLPDSSQHRTRLGESVSGQRGTVADEDCAFSGTCMCGAVHFNGWISLIIGSFTLYLWYLSALRLHPRHRVAAHAWTVVPRAGLDCEGVALLQSRSLR